MDGRAGARPECQAYPIPDSCALSGGSMFFNEKAFGGRQFAGAIFYVPLSRPRPIAANVFQLILVGQRHIADCDHPAVGHVSNLADFAECILDRF